MLSNAYFTRILFIAVLHMKIIKTYVANYLVFNQTIIQYIDENMNREDILFIKTSPKISFSCRK